MIISDIFRYRRYRNCSHKIISASSLKIFEDKIFLGPPSPKYSPPLWVWLHPSLRRTIGKYVLPQLWRMTGSLHMLFVLRGSSPLSVLTHPIFPIQWHLHPFGDSMRSQPVLCPPSPLPSYSYPALRTQLKMSPYELFPHEHRVVPAWFIPPVSRPSQCWTAVRWERWLRQSRGEEMRREKDLRKRIGLCSRKTCCYCITEKTLMAPDTESFPWSPWPHSSPRRSPSTSHPPVGAASHPSGLMLSSHQLLLSPPLLWWQGQCIRPHLWPITALFTTVKTWKHPVSISRWMCKDMVYVNRRILFSHKNGKKSCYL